MTEKQVKILIGTLSVLIPLFIGYVLFSVKTESSQRWVYALPHINGVLNSFTAIALLIGFYMIKSGRKDVHRLLMTIAFFLASLFFISYIIYHSSVPSQMFGDINKNGILDPGELELIGARRIVYLIILISHILLAVVLIPLVLFAFYFALNSKFEKHRKIVKFTLPIWLYVSISGVIVYLMISGYY